MIQQSMRLKVLILPLSLVVVVVMSIFYIKPAYSEMMALKKTVEEKQSQLESLKNQNQKLTSVKAKWDTMTDEKTLVASALPDTDDVDAYVSELTSKASRSGILLTKIAMQQKSDSTSPPAYVCGTDAAAGATPASTPAPTPAPATASAPTVPSATAGAVPGVASTADLTASPSSCLQTVGTTLTATGSWEQILDYFQYLENFNRISNIQSVTLSTGSQGQVQASSDLLQLDISAVSFFKKKITGGNMALANSLASQGKFNQSGLDKLKAAIYAPYAAPDVSPSGERNIFK